MQDSVMPLCIEFKRFVVSKFKKTSSEWELKELVLSVFNECIFLRTRGQLSIDDCLYLCYDELGNEISITIVNVNVTTYEKF